MFAPTSMYTIYNRAISYRPCLFARRHFEYVILIVGAINVIFIGGKRRCFGVFLTALHDTGFNGTVSMTTLNWIGDSYAALGFFLMPLMTTAILYFNKAYRTAMAIAAFLIFFSCLFTSMVSSPYYMFLTHTLLHGIGSSLILSTTPLIVNEYFDKSHRLHVLATTLAGGGVFGGIIFCPLYSVMVVDMGWRAAFFLVGVMFFVEVMLGAAVYDAKPEDAAYESLDESESMRVRRKNPWSFCTAQDVRDNPQIVLWCIERALFNIMLYSITMNTTDFMTSRVDSLNQGAVAALSFNMGETTSYIVGLLVGDKMCGFLPLFHMSGAFVKTVFLAFLMFFHNNNVSTIALLYFVGAATGMEQTVLLAASEEVMQLPSHVSFPMVRMGASVGMLLAPLTSGVVIDQLGFGALFVTLPLYAFTASLLMLAINLFLLRRSPGYARRRGVAAPAGATQMMDLKSDDEENETTPIVGCGTESQNEDGRY